MNRPGDVRLSTPADLKSNNFNLRTEIQKELIEVNEYSIDVTLDPQQEETLSVYQEKIKESRDGHKHNFLARYFDHMESVIS